MPTNHQQTCDVFCHVVDNYGDIGVGWRLVRQLVHEYSRKVRLFVDDLNTFASICPRVNPKLPQQTVEGVQILIWSRQTQLEPAELVIELFGCRPAAPYVERIEHLGPTRVRWLNLEHLSAEAWVEGAHLKPSPQPGGINKIFFFPGFTPRTGGLLRERDLLARHDAWQALPSARRIALRALGLPPPPAHALSVLLFSYRRGKLEPWLQAMAAASRPTVLWVCPGPVRAEIDAWLNMELLTGQSTVRGSLTLCALPFVPQERFDELLWAADLCIVRGEDSFVRAQWAARPFLWHAYPQDDGAHLVKIQAFLDLYLQEAPPALRPVVDELWLAWNRGQDITSAWHAFVEVLPALQRHASAWSRSLASQDDLARQLLRAAQAIPHQGAPL